jgi:hypothetical protein
MRTKTHDIIRFATRRFADDVATNGAQFDTIRIRTRATPRACASHRAHNITHIRTASPMSVATTSCTARARIRGAFAAPRRQRPERRCVRFVAPCARTGASAARANAADDVEGPDTSTSGGSDAIAGATAMGDGFELQEARLDASATTRNITMSGDVSTSRGGDDDGGDDDDNGQGRGGGDGDDGGDGGGDGDDEARARRRATASWTRDNRRDSNAAVDGGALFGAVVGFTLNGVAWIMWRALRPSASEREAYAKAAESAKAKAPKPKPTRADEERDVSPPKVIPQAAKEDEKKDVTSAPIIGEEPSHAVRVVSVAERSSDAEVEDAKVTGEVKESDVVVAPFVAVAIPVDIDTVEEVFIETSEPDEYDPTPEEEEDVDAKLHRAMAEANAILKEANEKRFDAENEFQEALKYRLQIAELCGDRGIAVAPIRKIKETIDDEPVDAHHKRVAMETARKAVDATKQFVVFATPHVKHASARAFEFAKTHGGEVARKAKLAVEDIVAKRRRGELKAPTLTEAKSAARATSRRILGGCIHAYDEVMKSVRDVVKKERASPKEEKKAATPTNPKSSKKK